jgi:2-polyprenyl-3-methyl-5-hydroxy-6-metoxy-1,4-benzoquinol methylase
MANDYYLPNDAPPGRAADVLRHLRNKNMTVELARPTIWQRAMRRLWWMSTQLWDQARASGPLGVIVSEQVIENAFLLRELGPSVRKVLDFGAFESTLPLSLAALGLDVTVVDQRPYPFTTTGLRVLLHDILQPLDALSPDFDLVYSISTVEHVGLGNYGDASRPDGDRIALANLWAKVRPGGRLIFSVPAGQPTIQRGYRVYDEAALRAILPHDGEITFFIKRGRRGSWRRSRPEEMTTLRYENYMAQAPSEGLAIVVLRKPGEEAVTA